MLLRKPLQPTDRVFNLPPDAPLTARLVVDEWDGDHIDAASMVVEVSSHEALQCSELDGSEWMTDDVDDNRHPLSAREKEVLRSIGIDTDLPGLSDEEWREYIAAHNAVVHRKGLGVPVAAGEVEEELARRRAKGGQI